MPLKGLRLYTLMINLTLLDARSKICLSQSDLGKNTARIMELLIVVDKELKSKTKLATKFSVANTNIRVTEKP
tara:strand:- start:12555 stop:12773 length:219 start_codon:yes stop_codon:yes gene_type:complete